MFDLSNTGLYLIFLLRNNKQITWYLKFLYFNFMWSNCELRNKLVEQIMSYFLYFKRPFETIERQLILDKLYMYGIRNTELKWRIRHDFCIGLSRKIMRSRRAFIIGASKPFVTHAWNENVHGFRHVISMNSSNYFRISYWITIFHEFRICCLNLFIIFYLYQNICM